MAMYRMVPERDQPDGWRILHLGGVPVYADGWFLAYMVIIFVLYESSGLSAQQAGLACFVVFFSLLLHELGHAFMARFCGVRELYVRLTFFQGFAAYNERLSRGQSLAVVSAGPAVTLALCIGSWVPLLMYRAGSMNLPEPAYFVLSVTQFMNTLWFIFNIMPIYPMDGGQILYHTLTFWKMSQSALLITAKVSLVFCVIGGLWGLSIGGIMIPLFCLQFFLSNWQIIQSYGGRPW